MEERKVSVLIKLRGYKLSKKEESDGKTVYLVRTPRNNKRALIWCIPEEGTVGIAIVKELQKTMGDKGLERGIIVTSGKYTHAAKLQAKKSKIELLPRTFPSFDIFQHKLVPKHEILTSEEKEEILSQYRVKPFQLPQIKASDPAVKAIGARPGDILRIVRESPTAGIHMAYRYVVQ